MTDTLVTGASGFIGSALAKRLLKRGERIRLLLRKSSTLDMFTDEEKTLIDPFFGDLTKPETLEGLLDGVNLVYHIAGATGHGLSKSQYWDVNEGGTQNLIGKVKYSGVSHFIHCSSAYVMGLPQNCPASEDDLHDPQTEYEKSKYAAEEHVHELAGSGISYTILRPPPVFGPGDTGNLLKIFKMVSRGFFPLVGSGENIFQTVYVENLVDAFLLSANNKGFHSKTLHVADEPRTLREFVLSAADAMGQRLRMIQIPYSAAYGAAKLFDMLAFLPIEFPMSSSRLRFMSCDYNFQTNKVKALGWAPNVGFQDAMIQTIRWYRAKGIL